MKYDNIERWMPINGYPLYFVSNMGKVKSFKRKTPRFIKGAYLNGYRYLQIFGDNGKSCRIFLHRIVAMAFCPGYKEGLDVNHKDGNKTNSRVSNLEWVTRSENCIHAEKMGLTNHRKGERHVKTHLRDVDVIAILKRKGEIPYSEISATYGISKSIIKDIYYNRTWKHIPRPTYGNSISKW